jgi:hypothetical protein
VCSLLLGQRVGAAWMRALRAAPWISPLVLLMSFLSVVFSCLCVFDAASAFRGWTPAALIAALAAPGWLVGLSMYSVPMLRRMLTVLDTYFLLLTAAAGLTALAYALDNCFDDRTLVLLGGWLPCIGIAIFSDAGRPSQRRLAPILACTGTVGCTVFMARLCTLRASRYDQPLMIWTLHYAISNLAFNNLLTVAVFLLRATVMLWLRPGSRFMLSAPMLLVGHAAESGGGGESVFQSVTPGALVLAPARSAAILFECRRTVAAMLLGERRAAALWRLFKAVGWLAMAAQVGGMLLGACILFDLAAGWVAGAAVPLLMLPSTLLCVAFMNVSLLTHLTARFEVLYLAVQALSWTLGGAAMYAARDPRALVYLVFGISGAFPVCFLDSWHLSTRRTGAKYTLFGAVVGTALAMASIAVHVDLAQAAPSAHLGTLNWQSSKAAFDAGRVFIIFFVKHFTMLIVHPARFGQLRTPLVAQRAPAPAPP